MIKTNTQVKLILVIVLVFLILPSSILSRQDIQVETNPGARWGHILIYDAANDNILLFGGANQRGGDYLGDTWIWRDNEWKKIDSPGPPARGFCAATFHKGRNTVILHGGRGNDGVTYSDLWEWNGISWRQLEKNSAYKADHHQMVYVHEQDAILAFGGWNGEDVLGDTWFWNEYWKKADSPSPPKRASFSMVYNDQKNSVLLFGGLWVNGQYADIWEWTNNQWHALSEPYQNSSLDHHAMIYDSQLQQVIGFGGKNYRYILQNATFKIEGDAVKVITMDGPKARHSFGFTYDSGNHQGYLFGGKEYLSDEQIPLDDFWRWDGLKWHNIPLTKNK